MKVLALTLGDVNGIGPEVTLKAMYRRWPADTRLVAVGARQVAAAQARRFDLPCPPAWQPGQPWPGRHHAVLWDPAPDPRLAWQPGCVTARAARNAISWIQAAVAGCQSGIFTGLVTAPICKAGLKKAGLSMPGHTEYLAELTGTRRFAMLLMGAGLRVVLATRHLPLRQVADALTTASILDQIQLCADALPWLGLRGQTIGVCGLNPHAGDGGALGDEERRVIAPAIRRARQRGIKVEGPVPADVMFYLARQGRFGAVVAMYHDQGLAPLKMLAFENGINVTLGLPIIRTSPDHGTAFDIAGQGQARPDSMLAAIELAGELAGRPNPWARRARRGHG